jgi:hypothetical protein
MQQHATRRLHAGMEVDLRVCKRHCHELEHFLYAWVHAAQV